MKILQDLLNYPVFFKPNRVRRIYTGGALLDAFCGKNKDVSPAAPFSGDGFFPEEWIASTVRALNEGATNCEGLSLVLGADQIENREVTFAELLASSPEKALGKTEAFDVLVKFLDSAVRLPVQAHPTKEFSRAHFGCNYGKTESWLVLATRENAEIYFGFDRKMTKEEFSAAVERSKTDKNALAPLLGKTSVRAGDLFLIPAGLAHAIGYGCLILEVQEPTDFTIQPEYYCGDYALSEREMYIGLTKDVALTCFDYSLYGEKAIAAARKTPRLISQTEDYSEWALITYEDTPCFAFSRYDISGKLSLPEGVALYVVINGEGKIVGNGAKQGEGTDCPAPSGKNRSETASNENCETEDNRYFKRVRCGDYFFLPAAASGYAAVAKAGETLSLVRILPSVPQD